MRNKIPLTLAALFSSAIISYALTDAKTDAKTEGTANPSPIESPDDEKAILSTIRFPEGMEAKLFAREPDVQDPTAITFDEQNRLYIAETHRFARGVEDNRRHPWVADDYKLTTTAERLEMYKKSDIKTRPPAISTMPPMGLILSKPEIRDLVAFLSSLK